MKIMSLTQGKIAIVDDEDYEKYELNMYENNSSGLRGVSWNKRREKWESYARKDNKQYHLGLFDNKDDAGRAYDKKALELFGEFVLLNFPEKQEEKTNVAVSRIR